MVPRAIKALSAAPPLSLTVRQKEELFMKMKGIVVVNLLFVVAIVAMLASSSRPTPAADPPQAATVAVGRYQLLQDKDGNPKYLFDTASARIWRAQIGQTSGVWKEYIEGPKTWTPPPLPGSLGPRKPPP